MLPFSLALLLLLPIFCFLFAWSLSVPFRAEGQIRVEESPAEAFVRSDGNQDGALNFDEFLHTDALFEALKRDEFSQLDANSDGKVSRAEYYPGGGWYQGTWTASSSASSSSAAAAQMPPLPFGKNGGGQTLEEGAKSATGHRAIRADPLKMPNKEKRAQAKENEVRKSCL